MLELMSGGTTVFFVSHDIAQINKMCNKVVWLERGKMQTVGKTKDVIKEYQSFLGIASEN